MAAVVGRQWSLMIVSRPHSNGVLHIVAQAKSTPAKSNAGTTTGPQATTTTTTTAAAAAAAVASMAAARAAAAKATASVVVASKHSNARIEKSNRRSRFGDPFATTDCEDDDDLYAALSSEMQSLEMGDLEDEVNGRKGHRRVKKVSRAGAKRFDSIASTQVVAQVQKGGVAPEMKLLGPSDGPNSVRIRTKGAAIKIKSSTAHKQRLPVKDKFLTGIGEKYLARKAWEEQAYEIIRQQKLRDAGRGDTNARIAAEKPKGLAETKACDTLAKSPANDSPQHKTPVIATRGDTSTRIAAPNPKGLAETKASATLAKSAANDSPHHKTPAIATRRDTNARIVVQKPKGLAKTRASETLVKSTANDSLQQKTPVLVQEGASLEDIEFSSMARRLHLDDKCRPLVEYLHALGVRERDYVRIVDRHQGFLHANVNVVKERVEFLLALGVQGQHLPKLIARYPQILSFRVEQAMKPRVQYLKSLGLDDSKIGKIITVSPSLLECSLERSIKPRVTYLVKTVGIKSEDIGNVILRSPQILTQSIEESLEPRIDFFLHELNLSKEAFSKMVTRHPQLLHYSIEDGVRPRVMYLRSLGMSDDDVMKVLTRLTQILSLSIEKCLQPKYTYLVKELKGGVQTVTSFPAYFSLSLDQRIIPRHRYLQVLERTPKGPFPMRLLTISDIAFCEWAKSSLEAYDKFRHDLLLSTFAKNFEWKNSVHI